jgi:hypothetical protein
MRALFWEVIEGLRTPESERWRQILIARSFGVSHLRLAKAWGTTSQRIRQMEAAAWRYVDRQYLFRVRWFHGVGA